MEWYLKVLRQYADFSGRARRKEFWMFVLIDLLIALALGVVDYFIGIKVGPDETRVGILGGLYGLGTFIPHLAVTARRLHDTGRSGWWMFIALVPLVGWIFLLVYECQDSQFGDNEYGPYPKGELAY